MTANAQGVTTLMELGFSEYEARTYAGLVGREPLTGYGLAKATGVPQPKVYETLNRLAERGAVVKVSSDPGTWVAIPPDRLLQQLENDFRRRLVSAELELHRLQEDGDGDHVRPLWGTTNWARIAAKAAQLLEGATKRIYISAHQEQLSELSAPLRNADRRGIRIDVLTFGEASFELVNGDIVRHRSTEGVVYPHHQARHLALATDGANGIWALARSGTDWEAVWVEDDPLLPALIKGYIRHDLYVQRIYADLGERLHEIYGPSLEGMTGHEPYGGVVLAESESA